MTMFANFIKQLFGARHPDRLKELKASMTRKDADKPAIARQVDQPGREMTVLDPARAIATLN
jgi:hypothetical protein